MSKEDITGQTLSDYLNQNTDSDSDSDVDLEALELETIDTPAIETNISTVDEITEEDMPVEESTVLESTFKIDIDLEQLNKIKNLPVKKFFSRSKDNDDIGSGINDWRKRLSNFYISEEPIIIDDMSWTTLEGLFQASKFMYNKDDPVYMNYIAKFQHEGEYGSDPKKSKRQGGKTASKKNKVVLDPNWDTLRNKVMFKGLVYRIAQQPDIRSILEKIKDAYFLLHHSTKDTYWGGSKKGAAEIKGKNVLGSMYTFLANHIDKINTDTYKETYESLYAQYTNEQEVLETNIDVDDITSKGKTDQPYRIALTFGDAGENHVGMEMVGTLGEIGSGFTTEELQKAQQKLTDQGITSTYHSFDKADQIAGILIIRNVINKEEHAGLLKDMNTFVWDNQYFDRRRKKVLNKHARTNVVILDGIAQEPDYLNKKGRIVDTNTLETFKKFKQNMVSLINTTTETNKADNLICEGNRYYDLKKCGIGYHGDKERRKVIALSLGESTNINWQWFQNSKPVGDTYKFTINGGDIYIMSEKAVGYDWGSPSKLTLRHAAGAKKYTCLDKYDKKKILSEDIKNANKKIIKKNDYSSFELTNYDELENRFISLEEAYNHIEDMLELKKKYNDYVEKNITKIITNKKYSLFDDFVLDNNDTSSYLFKNVIPSVYTDINDNNVTYMCNVYNVGNDVEINKMIQQEIYSKQITIPKMDYYTISKKNINETLQHKLLNIQLRSLLNKINLLDFIDIKKEEVDTLKDTYKKLFNIIKKEYTDLDTIKENIYTQYKKNIQDHKHDKEDYEFIKQILTINFSIYYYYKKGKYYSIFKKNKKINEESEEEVDEDEHTHLDFIYGKNMDLLQQDHSNKDTILSLQQLKKVLSNKNMLVRNGEDDSLEKGSTQLRIPSDIITHLMYHSFQTSIKKYKHNIFTQTEIMITNNDNNEEICVLKRYGEKPDESDDKITFVYENKNNNHGKIVYTNDVYMPNKSILIMYIDAEQEKVGNFVRETIVPEDKESLMALDKKKYKHWRSQLSNEYTSMFVVDGLCFNSVEHYLQFSKFNNRTDITDMVVKRNHQIFADRFAFSNEYKGIYSHVSGKQAYIEGSAQNTQKYNITIHDDWLSIRTVRLKKALYAKCYQHKDIQEILKLTGTAILSSPFKGKERTFKYRINNELMDIRKLLTSEGGIQSLDFYINYDDDYQKYKIFISSTYKNIVKYDYQPEDIENIQDNDDYTDEDIGEISSEEEEEEQEEEEEEDEEEEDEDTEIEEDTESEEEEGDNKYIDGDDVEDDNVDEETGQKPSSSSVNPYTIKDAIQAHIKKRFLLLRSHLDDNPTLKVVIAGNPNLTDVEPESAMYMEDAGAGEHKYFGARGHLLGVFRAHKQWKVIISDPDEFKQIYVDVLQLIDREVDDLFTSYNDRISFSDVLMQTPDTQANNDRYIVWGANVTNWNLDTGTKIIGRGQASDMDTQQTGIFGIVTTPLGITSNNISTLQDIDKTHPEIVSSDDGGAVATKESQPDTTPEPLSTVLDETLEKELDVMEGMTEEDLEEPDLFLQKFLTSELDLEFTTALTELQQGRKEGHWIWWFFPQAPFGKTPRSLEYSFENKKQVQDYVNNPKLFERLVLLLDTLLAYKQEHPDDTLLQIFAKNDSTREFTDKNKFLSSLTLFYKVLTQNNETIQQQLGSTTNTGSQAELNKTLTNNKTIIDKILRCKESFGEEFVFDSQTEQLLNMVSNDEDDFKETMKGSATFSGGGLDTSNTMNHYDPHKEKLKNIDPSTLSNLENLKNLVGGKVDDTILQISLQNNDNNVYSSLQSLLNPKTREIYELLAKNK